MNALLQRHLLRGTAILSVALLLMVANWWIAAAIWSSIALVGALLANARNQQDTLALLHQLDSSKPNVADSKQLFTALRQNTKDTGAKLVQAEHTIDTMHRAVDNLPDSLIVLDRFNMVSWYNQAAIRLHGLRRNQLPIHHFIRLPAFVNAIDQQPPPNILRAELAEHPGRFFDIHLLTEQDFKVVITRDVTERVRVDRLRSDFIANVSHEIRTPLTVVAGYAESLAELDLSKDEQQRYLTMIVRQSQTMRGLVEDLLTLSRLENTEESLAEDVDASQLIAHAKDIGTALSGGRHSVTANASSPSTIKGNRDDLDSALRNLVTNAVRYSPEGSSIAIQWDGKELSVSDTGLGIAAEHIPLLTERFYRVDKSRSRDLGGTGLGLAIVKRIAKRHRAELLITSTLGQGSRFALRFS